MDYSQKLALSYYKVIATLNESHHIFLVQHQETHKIFIKKILTVYNIDIYKQLSEHPVCGIPQIIDFYEDEHRLILIENYISGQSLEDIIHTTDFDLSTVIHYALELCTILHELHHMHPPIIHRDIKPSNIIITEYNHVVLLDFNAAKHFSPSSTNDTILLGTKGYAAPEQYGFGSSSPKTDIYAFGILLKELTSSFMDVPLAFTKIIEKCIEINPSDRYDTVTDLENALKNLNNTSQIKKPFSSNDFLLPGFRTHTLWKMLFASSTYLFLFWLSISLEVENSYGIALWIERFFCFSIFLSIIFGTFNYLNIHNHFSLCKSKYRIIRILGIVLLDTMFAGFLFIIMTIILSMFFPTK